VQVLPQSPGLVATSAYAAAPRASRRWWPPTFGSRNTTRNLRVDENVAFFRGEVLPAIKASPGFRAVRNLIDRTTGRGLSAIIVSDEDALRTAEVGFEARKPPRSLQRHRPSPGTRS
jgi:hypothetical protein